MARRVSRSSKTGQFVSPKTAKASPKTTTTERVGRGTSNAQPVNRSAITGKFLSNAYAKRHPDTTIRQWV